MKKYLFAGAERTGKSTNLLFIVKILAQLGREILVLDTTYSQGVSSFFYLNENLETETEGIIRDSFHVAFNKPYEKIGIDKLEELDLSGYDYVFVEGDINVNSNFTKAADKILFFQDYDRASLMKNQLILNKLDVDGDKIIFVFNNTMDSDFDTTYLLQELVSYVKRSNISKANDFIEIPFNERDIVSILEGKNNGKLRLKLLSDEYKNALYELVNIFESIDKKEYAKIVK